MDGPNWTSTSATLPCSAVQYGGVRKGGEMTCGPAAGGVSRYDKSLFFNFLQTWPQFPICISLEVYRDRHGDCHGTTAAPSPLAVTVICQ